MEGETTEKRYKQGSQAEFFIENAVTAVGAVFEGGGRNRQQRSQKNAQEGEGINIGVDGAKKENAGREGNNKQ